MLDKDYWGKDKVKHMLACFGLSIYSTEAAIVGALTKEYADSKAKGNHWCWWDLAADTVGIIAGTAVRLILTGGAWNWF